MVRQIRHVDRSWAAPLIHLSIGGRRCPQASPSRIPMIPEVLVHGQSDAVGGWQAPVDP